MHVSQRHSIASHCDSTKSLEESNCSCCSATPLPRLVMAPSHREGEGGAVHMSQPTPYPRTVTASLPPHCDSTKSFGSRALVPDPLLCAITKSRGWEGGGGKQSTRPRPTPYPRIVIAPSHGGRGEQCTSKPYSLPHPPPPSTALC